MNIGFDAKRAFNNSRGLGNYSRTIIENLIYHNNNYNYILFTPKTKISLFNPKKEKCTIIKKNSLFHPFWRSKKIIHDLIENNIKLYHGLSNELPIGIHKKPIKTIVTIHDLLFLKHPKLYPFFDRLIYKWKTKYACFAANHIIATSNNVKKQLIDYLNVNPNKISVVYQSCNQLFQKDINKKDCIAIKEKFNLPEKFILCVGTIEKRKNLMLILKQIHKIEEKLVIVGKKGNAFKKIMNFIEKNHLNNKILFLEKVLNIDLPFVYSLSNALIFPSIDEGFGIPIIEALFTKTPVICLNKTATFEAGGKNSIYINSINELPQVLNELKKNKFLKKKIIKEGYIHAQKFSSKKTTEKLLNIYKKVAHE